MTEALCTTPDCAYPRPDEAYICRICVQALEQDLGSVPALLDELTITTCRLDHLGVSERGAGEQALPFKAHASEAADVLRNTIGTWARDLADRVGVTPPATHAAAARWMLRYVQSLTMHPAAGEACDEIASAVRLAYEAIDRPPDLLAAGKCGFEYLPGWTCERRLYVQPDHATVKCPDCGTRHDVAARREWMADYVAEMRVTKTVALGWMERLLGRRIPDPTWRSWIYRRRLTVATVSPAGHELFRFGTVRDLAEASRQRVAAAVA
jgi:hypothetical protein